MTLEGLFAVPGTSVFASAEKTILRKYRVHHLIVSFSLFCLSLAVAFLQDGRQHTPVWSIIRASYAEQWIPLGKKPHSSLYNYLASQNSTEALPWDQGLR